MFLPRISAAVAVAIALLCGPALAADLSFPIKAAAVAANPCTVTSCSGWYVGVGLTGNGTNADIVGNGVNQSVFAAGGILDVHGGYQMWNGTYLFGAEVGIGNQFSNGPIGDFGSKSLIGYEIVKFGGSLTQLFNTTATTTAGQAPAGVTVPSALANAYIAPYVAMGAIQRAGINQWATGAGAEFVLAQSWNLDLRYMYAPALNDIASMNLVTIGVNYHFGAK